MKCKKIKGIEKSVCTAEQKIAYNYAFQWYDIGKKILNDENTTEANKSESMHYIEDCIIKSIKKYEIDKKYNIDAIMVAFRQGFKDYCKNFFIANDYETIGKYFTIPYVIE
jgi:hypothetical protein